MVSAGYGECVSHRWSAAISRVRLSTANLHAVDMTRNRLTCIYQLETPVDKTSGQKDGLYGMIEIHTVEN